MYPEVEAEQKIMIDYWRKKVENMPSGDMLFPLRKKGRATALPGTTILRQYLPDGLLGSVNKLCNGNSFYVYCFFLSAIKILLHRYTGQELIYVTTASLHLLPEDADDNKQKLHLLSSLIKSGSNFKEVYELLKEEVLQVYKNQQYRSPEIDQHMEVAGQHTLCFVTGDVNKSMPSSSGAVLTVKLHSNEAVPFIEAAINGSAIDPVMVKNFIENYIVVLNSIVNGLYLPVSVLAYVDMEAMGRITGALSDTSGVSLGYNSIPQAFERQVERFAEKRALQFDGGHLTYKQLNERAGLLANHLRKTLIRGAIVAVIMDNSEMSIIAMLGIMKAGGVYLPVDVEYPAERRSYILEDAGVAVVLTTSKYIYDFESFTGQLIALDIELAGFPATEKDYLPCTYSPDELAYIIYTSGSTGYPKGVMIEHGSCLNMIYDQIRQFGITETDRVLQFASLSFDASISEVFTALLSGACLVTMERSVLQQKEEFVDYLKRNEVSVVTLPPAYLHVLERASLSFLRVIVTAGESANAEDALECSTFCNYYNAYGPTECSVCVSIFPVTGDYDHGYNVPVGKPLNNLEVWILNGESGVVPVGVEGEICVAGVGLARGYVNNPSLTKEKFTEVVINHVNKRVYHTGDLGRWLADGNIEFLGRSDDQVKIRGYRVELGEIETALYGSGLVRQAVVIVREESQGDKQLIGYVVPEGVFNREAILDKLRSRLPEYMIPAVLVELDQIPLTVNGKVDRRALPEADLAGVLQSNYVAPRNKTEEVLCRIWQEVLGVERVGISDNFFELGGHSLRAVQVVSRVYKELGVKLELRELFSYPRIEELGKVVAAGNEEEYEPIIPAPEAPWYELSHAQRRLWILDRLEPDNIAYNISGGYMLDGILDVNAFKRSFEYIINRHEILRTVFEEVDGIPRQRVLGMEEQGFAFEVIDLREHGDKEERVLAIATREAGHRFNLSQGPLVRAVLMQLEAARYVFIITLHHIISDGWSMEVLTKEVLSVYENYRQGSEPSQSPLRIQYRDYARWQHQLLHSPASEQHRQYWLTRLSGELPVLELPADHERPKVKTYNGGAVHGALNAEQTKQLKELSVAQGASVFMILLATVKVLLYRYTGRHDIITGTTVAGRDHKELEDQVGFYVNTLALRNEVHAEERFDILLQRIKENTLEAYAHQVYPFDRLVDELSLSRDMSRHPLFDVLVELVNTNAVDETMSRLQGISVSPYETGGRTSKFDLCFRIKEHGEQVELELEYNSDLYNGSTMLLMLTRLQRIIQEVLTNSSISIKDIGMLEETESRQLITGYGQVGEGNFDLDGSIVKLIESRVLLSGDAVAVHYAGKSYSYQYINEQSNKLAHWLRRRYGVEEGKAVGMMLERSELSVIGVLGILKSGGVLVPIDRNSPPERKRHILQDAGCAVLVTGSAAMWETDYYEGGIIALDIELEGMNMPTENPEPANGKDRSVYILYTSGSTGRPKGVEVGERSLLNYILWSNDYYFSNSAGYNMALFTSLSFDLTLTSIIPPLLRGDAINVYEEGAISDVLRKIFEPGSGIKAVKLTPSHIKVLEALSIAETEVEIVIVGGEALGASEVRILKKLNNEIKIYNEYGPTEATIGCVVYDVDEDKLLSDRIPIGRCIGNSYVYVLNEGMELQPAGCKGELWIGGLCLSKGYYGDNEQTAARFKEDPYRLGAVIYRTGDLAGYRNEGVLEYFGRSDDQVKIRGYRVELGEIETALYGSGLVKQAVVIVREESQGDKQLIGYVVPEGVFNREAILDKLRSRLPEYMIPAVLVELDQIPLTVNGKVDRRALPAVDMAGVLQSNYVAPRNKTEEVLCRIWQEVLGVERVGISDNFFELGGHSLRAVQVVSRVYKELGVKLELRELFSYPRIEELGKVVAAGNEEAYEPIIPAPEAPWYELSHAQRRLWILDRLEPDNIAYNISGGYMLDGILDVNAFKRSFEYIINRHEILRTVFEEVDGIPRQRVLRMEEQDFAFEVIDLREHGDKEERALAIATREAGHRFNLSQGPLVRAVLMQLEAARYVFIITLHHIISDGWSMEVLTKEVLGVYENYRQGSEPSPEPLRIQYRDYARWQHQLLHSPASEQHRQYWLTRLSGELPVLELPADHERPKVKTYNGGAVHSELNAEQTKQLKELSVAQGASVFMILLATVKVLLYRYTGRHDIITGTTVAGRDHKELEDQVGFYVNTLALRNEVHAEERFDVLLQRIKENTLEAYAHQVYPFDRLVDELSLSRDMSRHPLFDVLVELVNTNAVDEAMSRLQGISVSPYETGGRTSKFDLCFRIKEHGEQVELELEYNSDLYNGSTMLLMLNRLQRIIQEILTNSSISIKDIGMLEEAESRQLITGYGQVGEGSYDLDGSIVKLIESRVLLSGDAVAVHYAGKSYSYQYINEQSNKLAHWLRRRYGVEEGKMVGMMLERSELSVISVLGILKSGGVLVPIDRNSPPERKRHILQDAGCAVLVTGSAAMWETDYYEGGIIALDIELEGMNMPTENPEPANGKDRSVYILYTSGSTGRPKGVEVGERSLLNYILWSNDYYFSNSAGYDMALFTSLSFDLTLTSIIPPLLRGDAINVYEEGAVSDVLRKIFEPGSGIRAVKLTPSHIKVLEALGIAETEVEIVIVGGEALGASEVRILKRLNSRIKIYNEYGPTEATIGCVVYDVDEDKLLSDRIPIGRCIGNSYVYVLNEGMELQPAGCKGELWIGGLCLSKGYYGDNEQTAARFKEDPYRLGAVIYRTGDLAGYRNDGVLEYFGRSDDQVKIRGYRVELGEIETALYGSGLVKQAVVIVKEESQGDKQLIGYVVPEGVFNREAILDKLRSRLPEYMIPAVLVELDQIPLTVNGKVDRRALPEADLAGVLQSNYVAPRNKTEEVLCRIWQEVLGVERVGISDNFFELGGHSLSAIRMVAGIRKELDVEIDIRDVFEFPTIGGIAGKIPDHSNKGIRIPALSAAPGRKKTPLSFSQERLWFIDKLAGSVQYHIPMVLKLTEEVDKDILEYAIREIVRRHEVLRTIMDESADGVWQQVKDWAGWKLEQVISTSADVEEMIRTCIDRPFNLSQDFMLRVTLIDVPEAETMLVIVIHHIAFDAFSMPVLVKEFLDHYRCRRQGKSSLLPELPVQYGDYAVWQHRYLSGAVLEQTLSYWKNKLQGLLPLDLPTDYPRPPQQSNRGASFNIDLGKSLSQGIRDLCIREEVTLFMALMTVFKILLYRYSGQHDISVGSPVSNRTDTTLEGMIGFFVNTLVFRNEVNGGWSFSELLKRVKETTLEAYNHQEAPFEKIVEAVDLPRDVSRHPLFQVMFIVQKIAAEQAAGFQETGFEVLHTDNSTAKFDLTFDIHAGEEGLSLWIEYCTDLFSRDTVERMASHFKLLLASSIANADMLVGDLPMLTPEEEELVSVGFNDTSVKYNGGQSIRELFAKQVAGDPAKDAINFAGKILSYKELDEQSDKLAHYLHRQGAAAGMAVGICMSRSPEMIIGILGIIKAGLAYVPIDGSYPVERINFMISDIGNNIIVADESLKDIIAQSNSGIKIISVDGDPHEIAGMPAGPLDFEEGKDRLVYIIYTSGSTGMPKGVGMEERAMVNLLEWQQSTVKDNGERRILQFASINFDASFQEIFFTLCYGGTLYLIDENRRRDMRELAAEVIASDITHLFIPFVVLKGISEYCNYSGVYPKALKWIFTAGEQLKITEDITALVKNTGLRLLNYYGPSETHVVSSYDVTEADFAAVQSLPPIGKPIGNTYIYILNEDKRVQPVGVPGEIFIGGVQVGRGYINRPDLTAEKFISDPYSSKTGDRLYRTGDIGRWLADGNIAFLGRADDQVKIRGYRVEPGEIETALHGTGFVKQGVVIVKEDSRGDKQLIGYVVPEGVFNRELIVAALRNRLPDYMIPVVLIEVDHIPLTVNGKVDRRALPQVDIPGMLAAGYVAPRNKTEEVLCRIWQEVLGVERVGINDNFFELGGHSLRAVLVVSRIHKALGVKPALRELFSYPRIADLSKVVSVGIEEIYESILPSVEAPWYELSHAQRRLWILDRLEPDQTAYNIPGGYVLEGALDVSAFKKAFEYLIDRHEVLRTVFEEVDGVPRQRVLRMKDQGFVFETIDLQPFADKEEQALAIATREAGHRFNLSEGPLVRAVLLQLEDDRYVFLFTIHHIISDAWSIEVMTKEVLSAYESYCKGDEPSLSPLRIQYKDYAGWQHKILGSPASDLHRQYWLNCLSGVLPVLELPTDHERPRIRTWQGASVHSVLDASLTNMIKHLALQQGASVFMVLLASVKALLYRYTGQEDMIIGTVVAGRDHKELEDQVGFYVNTLALRNEVHGDDNFEQLLSRVKENVLEAFAHQLYPFDRLVDELSLSRDMSRHPLFDVMVMLQNMTSVGDLRSTGIAVSTYEQSLNKSKFDLTFSFIETEDEMLVSIEYNKDIFEEKRINRMVDHYRRLLEAIITNREPVIDKLKILSAQEEQQLLHEFRGADVNYFREKSIPDLFEEQVKLKGSSVALVYEDTEITYAELNRRANQLGHYLKDNGVRAGTLVPICIDRSIEMIVGILGILKSGCGFVPVDPEYPADRIKYMLNDVGSDIVLSSHKVRERLAGATGIQVVELDSDWERISVKADIAPERKVFPGNPAYVMYTSGSTGNPKGVEVGERSLLNYILWSNNYYFSNSSGFDMALFTSLSFDLTLTSIFPPLLRGDTVYVYKEGEISEVLEKIFEPGSGVKAVKLTPSHIKMLSAPGLSKTGVEVVIAGGEALGASEIRILKELNSGIKIYNEYGPTEATVGCVVFDVDEEELVKHQVPIGRSIDNSYVYVLNEGMELQPAGCKGGLWIGGECLSKGYYKADEQTAARFKADPYRPGSIIYRTGDMAGYREDGVLEYFGRADDQVKIRGHRIELGEIENALQGTGLVKQCVVIVREDSAGDKQLVGYVVAEGAFDKEAMVAHMRSRLPEYMIPAVLVEVARIPLTVNGKVDRRALPKVDLPGALAENYVAPRSRTEELLCGIWQEVLGAGRVGISDNFFELGGHSLRAVQVVSRIYKELGVKLQLRELFSHPLIIELSKVVEGKGTIQYESIPRCVEQSYYRLSHAQRRLWILDQLEPDQTAYNIPAGYKLQGRLDIDSFKKAFTYLINRHEILRTVFEEVDGEPRQRILTMEEQGFVFEVIDLQSYADKEERALQIGKVEAAHRFNLSHGPLVRALLLQLDADNYVFLFTLHHIISDGWSMEVLTKEVLSVYERYRKGGEPSPEPLRIQYKDYAAWQHELLNGKAFYLHQEYWKRRLQGPLPVLDLPPYKKRPEIQTYRGEEITHVFSATLSRSLNKLSREQDTTLFMVLLSVLNVLFYKYTAQTDIIVGTTTAGRDHRELEDQIGFYLNTLALRSTFNGDDSFETLLASVKVMMLEAYDHAIYPFNSLVEDLSLNRDMSRSPVFDVLVEMHNFTGLSAISGLEEVRISSYDLPVQKSQLDMMLAFTEYDDTLRLSCRYSKDIFDHFFILKFLEHFEKLADAIAADTSLPLKKYSILSKSDEQLLAVFNDTDRPFTGKTMFDEIAAQVRSKAHKVAISSREEEFTYKEVWERSDSIAHFLQSCAGLQKGGVAAVIADRSASFIITVSGIMKAGGVYLPLSPGYPIQRKTGVLKQSGAGILLVDPKYCSIDFLNELSACEALHTLIFIDSVDKSLYRNCGKKVYDRGDIEALSVIDREIELEAADLSYIIFTSGSTGNPKGVMVEHRGMLNHLYSKIDELELNETSVIVQNASQTFDISIWQMFCALMVGGRTIVYEDELVVDTNRFIDRIKSDTVTVLEVVPAYLETMLDAIVHSGKTAYPCLKYVLVTGETLKGSLVNRWFKTINDIPLINAYGPTEASDDITHHKIVGPVAAEPVPIGRAIRNMRIYITDQEGQLCATGIKGEIWVSGAGVGRGYIHDAARTEAVFMEDPFREEQGVRLYKTGDMGRYREDGVLEYFGRKDEQVKLRGYRIELGEIESALQRTGLVKQSVVIVREDSRGDKQLIGYVVPEGKFSREAIIEKLRNRLPEYMIPVVLAELDQLPLTINGKIDRRALPEVDLSGMLQEKYVAPRSKTEKLLCGIWQKVLGVERIGIYDNFFELGGHSLRAVQVVSHIHKELGVKPELRDLFAHPFIAALSKVIAGLGGVRFESIERCAEQPYYELSHAQRRLWILDRLQAGYGSYNIPGGFILEGGLDVNAFKKAFAYLIGRHEVLRTVFVEVDGEPRQRVLSMQEQGFVFEVVDLQEYENRAERALQIGQREAGHRFNLSEGPLVRSVLLQLASDRYVFLFTLHHIISDGWSMEVLTREVLSAYESYQKDTAPSLAPLRIQYKDYANWQNKLLGSPSGEADRNYWLSRLSGELPVLELPADHERPRVKTYNGGMLHRELDASLTRQVKELALQQGASLFMVLLASVKVLLYRYTGQQEMIVGTTVAGRDHIDLEDQIGFYVNMMAVRSELMAEESFEELLSRIKQNMVEDYAHQAYPFDRLVDELSLNRDMSRNPLFDVVVGLLNTATGMEAVHEEQLSFKINDYSLPAGKSKFDLTINFTDEGPVIRLHCEYNKDIFEEDRIVRLLDHYRRLLGSVVLNSQSMIGELKMLSDKEEHQLLHEFNKAAVAASEYSIISLFEQQVSKTPEAVALVFEGKALTYQALNERANQIGHYLHSKGVGAGQLVGLCVERSLELISCILGILKTGAGYVPIDPSYPAERISYMLADSGVAMLFSNTWFKVDNAAIEVIELDRASVWIDTEPIENVGVEISKDNTAYVMYTSGSTGRPKGVEVTHGNVVSLVSEVSYVSLNGEQRLLSTGSLSFDATTFEYWGMLLNGGRLVLCPRPVLLDSGLLKELIAAQGITMMWFTSGWFNQLVETEITLFDPLKTILVGGDKLSAEHIRRLQHHNKDISILNGYGPTENTTFSLVYRIEKLTDGQSIPIGRPMENRKAYILDKGLQLCGVGVAGEICVGGAGLSRGYWGNKELTDAKFIEVAGLGRLYRTGDIGRWSTDGNIEFLGRNDDQVKLRGYRIELGEIESALQRSGLVKQSVVIVREDGKGDKQLVGYVVPEGNFNKEEIVEQLQKQLPDYMVPAVLVSIEQLPLTVNGKVDRKALPEVDMAGMLQSGYVAPRNKTEALLCGIWQEVLGVERIGINDNFFELGGDSIITIQAVSRIRGFGYRLQAGDIFEHPTIASLSGVMSYSDPGEEIKSEQGELTGEAGLLPIQHWFFESGHGVNDHFNQSGLFTISKQVSVQELQAVFDKLYSYHDALRFSYHYEEGKWVQRYNNAKPLQVETEQLPGGSAFQLQEQITSRCRYWQGRLSISSGELLRVVLMQTGDDQEYNRLFIVVHHLAIDGVSWRIILQDLELLLKELKAGVKQRELAAKGSSYREWQKSLIEYATRPGLLKQLKYWETVQHRFVPLGTDKEYNGAVYQRDMRSEVVWLDEKYTDQLLQGISTVYHTGINDILLSALFRTLCGWQQRAELVIGLEGHGREEQVTGNCDLSRTAGWFTTLYPVLLESETGNVKTDKLVKGIKEQLRKVPDKGLSYGVLKYLHKDQSVRERLQGNCWDVVFNYLGQSDHITGGQEWLSGAEEDTGEPVSEANKQSVKLEITSIIMSGRLVVSWRYSELQYDAGTIRKVAADYIDQLQQIIDYCVQKAAAGVSEHTPSDYGLGQELTFQELDKLKADASSSDIMSF